MSALMCPTTLVVARHGDAEYVDRGFSDEGGSLSHLGREQAKALAETLVSRRVAHIWCSDLSRAVQTAEISAARLGVGVTVTSALREVDIGDLRGQPFSVEAIQAVTRHWFDGDLAVAFEGGESGFQVVSRYADVLGQIADRHPGETVLVIAHQTGTCVALPSVAGNVNPSFAGHHELGNGESAELVVDSDGWRLTRWGSQPLGPP